MLAGQPVQCSVHPARSYLCTRHSQKCSFYKADTLPNCGTACWQPELAALTLLPPHNRRLHAVGDNTVNFTVGQTTRKDGSEQEYRLQYHMHDKGLLQRPLSALQQLTQIATESGPDQSPYLLLARHTLVVDPAPVYFSSVHGSVLLAGSAVHEAICMVCASITQHTSCHTVVDRNVCGHSPFSQSLAATVHSSEHARPRQHHRTYTLSC